MFVGVDLGSRAIKLATVKNGELLSVAVADSSFEPHLQARQMVADHPRERIAATGYGRHLAQKHFAGRVITEIKAHATGARHLFPECGTVLDVGGQDSKVIALDGQGRVAKFQMNDKCAAGTGRFMEMMATSLGYGPEEFSGAAAEVSEAAAINSMCAVFAESEVVSLRNRGLPPENIARAIHLSIVDRLCGMLERVGIRGELVFSGGVARNRVLVELLAERLQRPVRVPVSPEIVGALGAAVNLENLAGQQASRNCA